MRDRKGEGEWKEILWKKIMRYRWKKEKGKEE